jgi:hypothetical protein
MLAALGFEEAGIARRLRWYAADAARPDTRKKIFGVTPPAAPQNLSRAHVV